MDIRERYATLYDAITNATAAMQASLWTALPCFVVSVADDGQHAHMQPAIKSVILAPDGTTKAVDLPVLPNVPLHFPRGGGVSMTFPVAAGDEGLVIFSSRPTDSWRQSGDVQGQIDARMHDLSDGFALIGFRSAPSALSNVSTGSTQIRSDDGKQIIDIHPSGGLTFTSEGSSVAITADGIDLVSGRLTHNGKNIGSTHIHDGVTPGTGDTGEPV